MHRLQALMVLGLLTALSPFIGLPYAWLMWLLPLFGIVSFVTAFTLSRKRKTALTRLQSAEAAEDTHEESTGV